MLCTARQQLHLHPLFRGVDGALITTIAAKSRVVNVPAHRFVHLADDVQAPFVVLLVGSVKAVYRSLDGQEALSTMFVAPAVFSEGECLSGLAPLRSVETIDPSVLMEVPPPVLKAALSSSHALTMNLLNDLASRLYSASRRERSLAFDPIEVRLAKLFDTYVELYGVAEPGGVRIRVPLTQDDLANALGVARRSVTRALKCFGELGLVFKDKTHFVVPDPARLQLRVDEAGEDGLFSVGDG